MKNLISIVAIALLCLGACKKDNKQPATTTPTLYPVAFNISNFTSTIGDINGRTGNSGANTRPGDTLSPYINYIIYKVFDAANSNLIKTRIQTSADTAFGKILDTLPGGRYVFSVTASKDKFPTSQPSNDYIAAADVPGTDVFYKNVTLNIDSTVNQTLTLARIVSKLRIIFKDHIPFNIKVLTILPDPNTGYSLPAGLQYSTGKIAAQFPPTSGTYWYYTFPINIPDSLRGSANIKSEVYLLNPGSMTIRLSVVATDTSNKAVFSRKIYNIPLEVNKLTVLSGYLFDTLPGGNGTSVNVLHDWSTDSIVAGF
ncbi:hypothetical protein ACE38W_06520 [Chitinophaga sp. Hz27]|uniref:hypothetical protein n=1 Tax=Chitinophaga sp. Hz27 TaxID=3347169 RepID=UPI0035D56A2D